MKNSIDYNDIFDVMIKQTERNLAASALPEDDHYFEGRLSVLKELSEISKADIHEHHAEIADQLLKVRRVVNKM